jgi:hypothetical protein
MAPLSHSLPSHGGAILSLAIQLDDDAILLQLLVAQNDLLIAFDDEIPSYRNENDAIK